MTGRKALLLRAAASVLLLAAASYWMDWRDTFREVLRIPPETLLAAVLLGLAGILLGTLKWHCLLKANGCSPRFIRLLGLYWIGGFFNNLLPGRTGGDLVRAYGLSKEACSRTEALFSVGADRAVNLVALMLTALAAFLVEPHVAEIRIAPATLGWVVLFAGSGAAGAVVWLRGRASKGGRLSGILSHLAALGRNLVSKPTVMAFTLVLAFFYQAAMILSHYVIGRGLDIQLGIGGYFILIPITACISLLPVTLNGLGLRESAFIVLFARSGVPASTSVALSLTAVGLTAAISLVGGIWYARSGLNARPGTVPVAAPPDDVAPASTKGFA